jgi:hypothetical protein
LPRKELLHKTVRMRDRTRQQKAVVWRLMVESRLVSLGPISMPLNRNPRVTTHLPQICFHN